MAAVADPTDDPLLEPWDVFDFGAFETTAFVTAVLVGAYSFIADPTGQQDSGDVSEIRIFRQWRLGVLLVGADVLFKVGVLILQVNNARRVRVVAWTLLLMAVPWAPFFNKVVKSVWATRSVMSLMRERVARNELSAVMRDYLMLGNNCLTTTRVANEVLGLEFELPVKSLKDVLQKKLDRIKAARYRTGDAEEEERHKHEDEATKVVHVAFVEAVETMVHKSAWLPTRRELRRGPHPTVRRWFKLPQSSRRRNWWRRLRRLDWWRIAWTVTTVKCLVDPFPAGLLEDGKEASGEERGRPGSFPRVGVERSYILDTIDDCNGGGTLSQVRSSRSLPETLCNRCTLAVRGAVETFLESSSRAHADVCASEWLDKFDIDWRGGMEVILDVLWETAFVDYHALRVEPLRVETSVKARTGSRSIEQQPLSPPPPIVTTQKLLVFLFLVARSVLGYCPHLDPVRDRVEERLHTQAWWDDYWTTLLDEFPQSESLTLSSAAKVKTKVLQKRTAEELNFLLKQMESCPPAVHLEGKGHHDKVVHVGGLCGFDRCFLSEQAHLVVTRVTRTEPEGRR